MNLRREMDVVVIGHLAHQKDHLLDGTTVEGTAGSAYYFAAGASLVQGAHVGVVSRVGCDIDLTELNTWQVDLKGVKMTLGDKSAHFIVFQNEGSRIFSANWGVSRQFAPEDFPIDYEDAKYIHLATFPPKDQLEWLIELENKTHGTIFSADTFEDFAKKHPDLTRNVFQRVGIIFLNEEEHALLGNLGDVRSKEVLIKKGPKGVVYMHEDTYLTIPAVDIPQVVDTSGAGDLFAGVFLAFRSQNASIDRALEHAVRAASLSVAKPGVSHLHKISPQDLFSNSTQSQHAA